MVAVASPLLPGVPVPNVLPPTPLNAVAVAKRIPPPGFMAERFDMALAPFPPAAPLPSPPVPLRASCVSVSMPDVEPLTTFAILDAAPLPPEPVVPELCAPPSPAYWCGNAYRAAAGGRTYYGGHCGQSTVAAVAVAVRAAAVSAIGIRGDTDCLFAALLAVALAVALPPTPPLAPLEPMPPAPPVAVAGKMIVPPGWLSFRRRWRRRPLLRCRWRIVLLAAGSTVGSRKDGKCRR